MNKKYPITYILAAVLLGVIAIFGVYFKFFAHTSEKPQDTGTGSQVQTAFEKQNQDKLQKRRDNYSAYNTAVSSLDIGLCEKISENDTLKSECADTVYASQASKEKDKSLCEKITDAGRKSHCSNAFVYDSAVAAGDQSACDAITGDDSLKTNCTRNVVFAKIEDTTFTGTTNSCDSLTGADKEYCVGRIKKSSDIDTLQEGISTHNLDTCAKIGDTNMKATCFNTVYMAQAIEQKSTSLCNKITDSERKTTCLTQLSRFSDTKMLQEAITSNSLEKCSSIVAPDTKARCTDSINLKQAISTKNIAICDKIINSANQKQCKDSVNLILSQTNK